MRTRKLNKKNLKKFADNLYSEDSKGNIEYLPLCGGQLAKANGEITHCILGEMHWYFNGKTVGRPLTEKESREWKEELWFHPEVEKSSDGKLTLLFCDETDIVYALMGRAEIDVSFCYTKDCLSSSLASLATVNDSVKGNSETAQIRRAKKVQKKLYEIADTYLK